MPQNRMADAQRQPMAITTVTTTATIKPYQSSVRIIGTGTYTLTLPSPGEAWGRGIYHFNIKPATTGAYTISCATTASNGSGSATFTLALTDASDHCALASDGYHWYKVCVVTV